MDPRFLARISALDDPTLNQVLAEHKELHSELDTLQASAWLDDGQRQRLAKLKRAKLSQKDKLVRMLADRETQES